MSSGKRTVPFARAPNPSTLPICRFASARRLSRFIGILICPTGFPGRGIGLKLSAAGGGRKMRKYHAGGSRRRGGCGSPGPWTGRWASSARCWWRAALLTMIITIPMVSLSLRRGHAPLEQLARQASAINADSLKARFLVDAMPEELHPIAGRLVDLLQRLDVIIRARAPFQRGHCPRKPAHAPGGTARAGGSGIDLARGRAIGKASRDSQYCPPNGRHGARGCWNWLRSEDGKNLA